MERTVFPRVTMGGNKDAVQNMVSMSSPMAAAQVAGAATEMAQRRQLEDEANPEQGIGRTQMGGGG